MWTSIEDECLCRAYVQISEDGIVGNGQPNLTFWQRVRIRFHEQFVGANRTQESMESRMRTISKSCSAWKGALRKATSRQGSGTTQSDVEYAARRIFMEENTKSFPFEHCWIIIKDCAKWHNDPRLVVTPIPPMTTESNPTFPDEPVGTPIEQSTPTYSLARPEGRDKQKQTRNKKGKASAEPSELRQKHVAQMLEFGADMKDRAKARAEYEGERLELQRRKGKREDEQWEYTKK
ncbi:Glutathione S-transferase T3 [Linum perenne]